MYKSNIIKFNSGLFDRRIKINTRDKHRKKKIKNGAVKNFVPRAEKS